MEKHHTERVYDDEMNRSPKARKPVTTGEAEEVLMEKHHDEMSPLAQLIEIAMRDGIPPLMSDVMFCDVDGDPTPFAFVTIAGRDDLNIPAFPIDR